MAGRGAASRRAGEGDPGARRRRTRVTFDDGNYLSSAAAKAADADVAIVFATQWTTEGMDVPDLSLPGHQDALIAAVAAANPHTIVVLETGGPVLMPWLDKVGAVLEAWYPGDQGRRSHRRHPVRRRQSRPGGCRSPSRHRWTRPRIRKLDGLFEDPAKARVNYDVEGSDVGYRWYARQKLKPLFAFGHGLSYTSFQL